MGNLLIDANSYVPMEISRENDLYVYHQTNIQDTVSGIIINVTAGTSYDPLFSKFPQQSPPGTRVLVYHANYINLNEIVSEMRGIKQQKPIIGRLLNQISSMDPDCTIVNWECCSVCEKIQFPRGEQQNMKNLKFLIDKGHMAMFSDFSLKSLIKAWNEELFGPNPFVFISQFGGNFKIGFDRDQISKCSSSQLITVGQLSKQSNCQLKALEKTIVYSLNYNKIRNQQFYKVQLLTVALIQNIQKQYLCKINQYIGSAGHVLIRFPNGGSILTSMGHWCQLIKIKTSQQQFFNVALKDYGVQHQQRLYDEYNSLDYVGQQRFLSKNAARFIQQATPGNHYFKKKRFM